VDVQQVSNMINEGISSEDSLQLQTIRDKLSELLEKLENRASEDQLPKVVREHAKKILASTQKGKQAREKRIEELLKNTKFQTKKTSDVTINDENKKIDLKVTSKQKTRTSKKVIESPSFQDSDGGWNGEQEHDLIEPKQNSLKEKLIHGVPVSFAKAQQDKIVKKFNKIIKQCGMLKTCGPLCLKSDSPHTRHIKISSYKS
jgi:hypothetical protein